MGLAHSPRIVMNGLVLCLDAANAKSYPGSGTAWTDISGSGYNATLINGPTFNSGNGGSIVFDGVNDHIVLPNSGIRNLLSTDCTIMVICSYVSSQGLTFPTLIGSMSFATPWVGWRLVFTASSRKLNFANASGSNGDNQSGLGSNYIFPDNIDQFTHIACTWIAATGAKNIYINGVLDSSVSSSTYTFGENTSQNMFIGIHANGQIDNSYKGKVASTMLYNRALSPLEINQNFNALRNRFGI